MNPEDAMKRLGVSKGIGFKTIIKVAICVVIAFLIISTVVGSFYSIDERDRGVILRNGAVIGIAEPGLHWKRPFTDTVATISVEFKNSKYEGLDAYSKDNQPAKLRASVNWHIDPARVTEVYSSAGTADALASRTVDRYLPQAVENVFGQYNAVSAVQKRPQLVIDVAKSLRDDVKGPIVIDSVQIENIDFSKEYEDSIANRMKAEVAVDTRRQDLEKEKVDAQIVVTKAQAAANASYAQAEADAKSTRIRGEADAYAIKVKSDALAANPNLVELTKAERWDGKLPTTMLPNATVPFLDPLRK